MVGFLLKTHPQKTKEGRPNEASLPGRHEQLKGAPFGRRLLFYLYESGRTPMALNAPVLVGSSGQYMSKRTAR